MMEHMNIAVNGIIEVTTNSKQWNSKYKWRVVILYKIHLKVYRIAECSKISY